MEFTHANKRAPFRKLAELTGLSRLMVPEQLAEYRTSLRTQSSFGIVGMSPAVIFWRPELWPRMGWANRRERADSKWPKARPIAECSFSATRERHE